VENFLLYDFFTADGTVNEDVFAFSNGDHGEHALIVYHNKYAETRGWIRMSVGTPVKSGENKVVVQRSLVEGLNIHPNEGSFVTFRDSISNLEYIRSSRDLAEQGLYLELNAYKYHAFLDFRQVQDDSLGAYRRLYDYLGGRGVPDIEEALRELLLLPVLNPFRQIANPGYFSFLIGAHLSSAQLELPASVLDEATQKMSDLLDGIGYYMQIQPDKAEFLSETRQCVRSMISLPVFDRIYPLIGEKTYPAALKYLVDGLESKSSWLALAGWAFVHNLGKLSSARDFEFLSLSYFDEWQLSKQLAECYRNMEQDEPTITRLIASVRLLIDQQRWYSHFGRLPLRKVLTQWLADAEILRFLGVNRYKDILWFNKEAFEQFSWWMVVMAVLEAASNPQASASEVIEQLLGAFEIAQQLLRAEKVSGYQVGRLLAALPEKA
jgi:hypothetical protein